MPRDFIFILRKRGPGRRRNFPSGGGRPPEDTQIIPEKGREEEGEELLGKMGWGFLSISKRLFNGLEKKWFFGCLISLAMRGEGPRKGGGGKRGVCFFKRGAGEICYRRAIFGGGKRRGGLVSMMEKRLF